jgi:hypothetical protein
MNLGETVGLAFGDKDQKLLSQSWAQSEDEAL